MNEVRSLIAATLAAARERHSSWADILAAARTAIESQSPGSLGMNFDELAIYNPGKCPHPSLQDLWNELEQACGEEGNDAYIDGADFNRIIALVPEWLPKWAQRMAELAGMTKIPCPHCEGRGWVVK
jgi:hypothetical protein